MMVCDKIYRLGFGLCLLTKLEHDALYWSFCRGSRVEICYITQANEDWNELKQVEQPISEVTLSSKKSMKNVCHDKGIEMPGLKSFNWSLWCKKRNEDDLSNYSDTIAKKKGFW